MRVVPIVAGVLGLVLLIAVPRTALAGGHGEEADVSGIVSTDGLSGLSKWIADVYNAPGVRELAADDGRTPTLKPNPKWLFAVLVTAAMAVMGAVIAVGADAVLKKVGLDAKRMAHRE